MQKRFSVDQSQSSSFSGRAGGRQKQRQCPFDNMTRLQSSIQDVEEAVKRIEGVSRTLKVNSHDAKLSIHAKISRHVDTLRNRETWLLEQVDRIVETKENILQKQLARFYEAVGRLKSVMGQCQRAEPNETGASNGLEKSVRSTLSRFENLKMSPDESSSVGFKADDFGLHETLTRYGRITTTEMQLNHDMAFGDPSLGSTSLPCAVEDYEELEHTLLYKTISDLKMDSTESQFKTWADKQAWLMKTESVVNSNTPSNQTITLPGLNKPLSHIGHRRATYTESISSLQSEKSCSAPNIISWLQNTKSASCDVRRSSSLPLAGTIPAQSESRPDSDWSLCDASIETIDESARKVPSDDDEVRRHWLADGVAVDTESADQDLMPVFAEILRQDSALWLPDPNRCVRPKRPVRCNYEAACPGNKTEIEIESLNRLSCVSANIWLAPSGAVDVGSVCVANERCVSLDDCLSDRNCASNQSSVSDRPSSYWLLGGGEQRGSKSVGGTMELSPIYNYFEKLQEQPNSGWLSSASPDNGAAGASCSDSDRQFVTWDEFVKNLAWVQAGVESGGGEASSEEVFANVARSGSDQWLDRQSSDTPRPLLREFERVHAETNRKWLLFSVPPVPEENRGPPPPGAVDSNPWLLKTMRRPTPETSSYHWPQYCEIDEIMENNSVISNEDKVTSDGNYPEKYIISF